MLLEDTMFILLYGVGPLRFGKGNWGLIPFLIWVVNFDWTSGILIQLLICVVKLVSTSHGYKGETMRARNGDLRCEAPCYSQ